MSGAATVLHRAPFVFSSKPCESLQTVSIPPLPSSNLFLSRGFSSKRLVSLRNSFRGPRFMTELVRTPAFRRGDGEEGIVPAFRRGDGEEGTTMFEREAFITGPSEFSADIVAGGLEATLNRLSKWLVAALFGAVLIWRHDGESLWAAMGSVLNAVLSIALKQILNQERPASSSKSDPGMPSTHAQSIFFTVVFAVVSLVEWLGINGLTLTISGLALAFGSYLSWLRVSQQYHTISQVLVGSAVGSLFCILWSWLWKAFVLEPFVSELWVEILVIVAAALVCLGFALYVIKYWFLDEQ